MTQAKLVTEGTSLRNAFGQSLVELADEYDFVVFDGDCAGGTGVHYFRSAHPDRFIQCGIAEQNMMAAAAGFNLATGIPVFVTGFASFLLRAWEQARLSIAYNNANVKIVASHVGLDVGPDGASAQCVEDIACWRAIPNMAVVSPCDPLEVKGLTYGLLEYDGPVYMRTGRSEIEGQVYTALGKRGYYEIAYGSMSFLRHGWEITIIACGVMVYRALQAADILNGMGFSVGVVDMPIIKPGINPNHNVELINQVKKGGKVVVCEDHSIHGGLGSVVAEILLNAGVNAKMAQVGIRDTFGESGEPQELAREYGIDTDAIVKAARSLFD